MLLVNDESRLICESPSRVPSQAFELFLPPSVMRPFSTHHRIIFLFHDRRRRMTGGV